MRASGDFKVFLDMLATENEKKLKNLVKAAQPNETLRGQVQALTDVLETVVEAPNQLQAIRTRKDS